jgi:hypothetical protein
MRAIDLDDMLDGLLAQNREGIHLVPFFTGPVGIGKTAAIKRAARRNRVGFWDVRLAIKDTVDFTGVPQVVKGKTVFAPPGWLPGPDFVGYMFFDEYVQAMMAVQNVAGQIIYDRCIGDYLVPEGAVIVLAGNRIEDRAGVTEAPQNINNRVFHIPVEAHFDDLATYWSEAGLDQRVIAFLDARQELVCKPSKDAKAFPTPRTWEFCARILRGPYKDGVRNRMLMGAVGEGPASELIGFIEAWEGGLILWREALKNPRKADLPSPGAPAYALMNSLAMRATYDNLSNILAYLARVNREMANYGVSEISRLANAKKIEVTVLEHPDFTKWQIDHRVSA